MIILVARGKAVSTASPANFRIFFTDDPDDSNEMYVGEA